MSSRCTPACPASVAALPAPRLAHDRTFLAVRLALLLSLGATTHAALAQTPVPDRKSVV